MQAATARRVTLSRQCRSAGGGSRGPHTASCVLFPGNTVRKPAREQLGHGHSPRQPSATQQPLHTPVLCAGWASPEGPAGTHFVQGSQRPSLPLEKVPVAQSTQSKPNVNFPGDRGSDGRAMGLLAGRGPPRTSPGQRALMPACRGPGQPSVGKEALEEPEAVSLGCVEGPWGPWGGQPCGAGPGGGVRAEAGQEAVAGVTLGRPGLVGRRAGGHEGPEGGLRRVARLAGDAAPLNLSALPQPRPSGAQAGAAAGEKGWTPGSPMRAASGHPRGAGAPSFRTRAQARGGRDSPKGQDRVRH